jgi:hypothetical protein
MSGVSATCTYTRAGTFDVILRVTNGCDKSQTDTVRITVM